jgi:DNA-binding NarL/FixJ family response regulator
MFPKQRNDMIEVLNALAGEVKMQVARMMPKEDQTEGDILILIVAKSGRIRESLQALLQIMPRLKVVGVTSHSFSALQMLAQYKPSLILLDVALPDDGAWLLLKEIQRTQPQTPCLFLVNSIEQQRMARVAGANAALIKGFEAMELIATIEELLPHYSP